MPIQIVDRPLETCQIATFQRVLYTYINFDLDQTRHKTHLFELPNF